MGVTLVDEADIYSMNEVATVDLRDLDLKKVPAISETIDWARTLLLLHTESLDADLVRDTLNVILKFQEDIENVDAELTTLTNKALKS